MNYNLPNFLIVGAGKSGSTSLYHYLCQHPDVYMPDNKEPNFLVKDYQLKTSIDCPSYNDDRKKMIFKFDDYKALFENANAKMIGEATVTNLYQYNEAITNIKKYLTNDIRIIIILRDPIQRSFSNYAYAVELGYEKLNYEKALNEEDKRLKNNWSSIFAYKGQSEYYNQVKAYLDNFQHVHVLLTNELKNYPQSTLNKIFDFLQLEKISVDTSITYNPSGIPRHQILHNFLNQRSVIKVVISKILSPFISKKKLQNLAQIVRAKNIKFKMKNDNMDVDENLKQYFKPQIIKLEKLIDKDLSGWYK